MAKKDTHIIDPNYHPPFSGLIHVTGGHDVGKTTFAIGNGATPERTAFFDSDVKAISIIDQLKDAGHKFYDYYDLVELEKGKKPVEFHEAVIKLIDELPKQGLDAIVWDNWRPFSDTFHPMIKKNPKKYRDTWPSMGAIKGAVEWQEAGKYEGQIINQLLKIAPVLIITTHLKSHVMNNTRTGLEIPANKKIVTEKAILRVWLRHHPTSPIPIGLILKRPSKPVVTENGIETTNVLPRRMPICTWKEIKKYWENPAGNGELSSEFIPNEHEIALMSGSLSKDMKKIYEKGAEVNKAQLKLEASQADPAMALALKLKAEGLTIPKIKKALNAEGFDISISEISGWVN